MQSPIILPDNNSNLLSYGKWNCLVATVNEEIINVIPAHDGDFFPESPMDYIYQIRNNLLKKNNQFSWPIRVDIDIIQNCTDNCTFCYSRSYSQKDLYKNAFVEINQLESIIKELAEKGTKTVRFTGGGEPLLHPQILEIIKLPKKYGLKSCIITNGNLLNDSLCRLLVEYIDLIRVSLNAASNNTRFQIHRSSKGNNMLEIYHFLHKCSKFRETISPINEKPLIWSTYLISSENIYEMEEAVFKVKEAGVDSISFRPLYHNRLTNLEKIKGINLYKILENIKKKYSTEDFHVFIPKRKLETVWKLNPNDFFNICRSCSLRTIIEATNNGEIIKVCGLFRGKVNDYIGNINEKKTFSDNWLCKKHK